MPKIKKRGRPSKDTQSQDPNYCVIKDPLMEPYYVQKDRGVSIPGTPIGCDFEIGDDYSMGKYEKQYGNNL